MNQQLDQYLLDNKRNCPVNVNIHMVNSWIRREILRDQDVSFQLPYSPCMTVRPTNTNSRSFWDGAEWAAHCQMWFGLRLTLHTIPIIQMLNVRFAQVSTILGMQLISPVKSLHALVPTQHQPSHPTTLSEWKFYQYSKILKTTHEGTNQTYHSR